MIVQHGICRISQKHANKKASNLFGGSAVPDDLPTVSSSSGTNSALVEALAAPVHRSGFTELQREGRINLGGSRSSGAKQFNSIVGQKRQVTNNNINIGKLFENIVFHTTNFKESPQKVKETIIQALMEGINDVGSST